MLIYEFETYNTQNLKKMLLGKKNSCELLLECIDLFPNVLLNCTKNMTKSFSIKYIRKYTIEKIFSYSSF